MKEFDKQNFFILLGLSLIWFYFIYESQNLWANIFISATAFALYPFVTKVYEERSGFFSVLFFLSILGTGIGANYSGRGAGLTLLLTVLFFAYLWQKYWCMYPLLALGGYFYGIWFVIFALTVIFGHCLLLGRIQRLGEIHFIRGMLLVCVFLLPFNLEQIQNFNLALLPQFFETVKLLPQIKSPIQLNGVEMLAAAVILLLPWLFFFIRSIFASFADCRNEELENHTFMHLWWLLGIIGIFYLGKDFYPLIIAVFPPIAILLGWNGQRMEKNFNPLAEKLSHTPVADALTAFALLGFIWHYLGIWNGELVFESNLLAVLLLFIALIGVFIYYRFRDCLLFLLIQMVGGVVQIFCFYIYFYPVLSI